MESALLDYGQILQSPWVKRWRLVQNMKLDTPGKIVYAI